MKIKNIIPIFMALFVVACSAIGNNNNSSSTGGSSGSGGGTTSPPPEENLDLGLERAELSFYTGILDGELATLAERLTATSVPLPTVRYRRESFNEGLFTFLMPGGLDGTPVQASVTNDLVEQIYITNINSALLLYNNAVQTRRGGVAGNVPQKFWRNAVTARFTSVIFYSPLATRPTIFAASTGTEEVTLDADYALFIAASRTGTVIGQTNMGRTETLSSVNRAGSLLINFFPGLPPQSAILLRTNATALEYREIDFSGTGAERRYFLREDDRGFITYDLVN